MVLAGALQPSRTGLLLEPTLKEATDGLRGAVIAVGAASGLINILGLTGSIFMLQVYDRVIPSRSFPTLLGLAVLALLLYAFQGALEIARSRLLIRIGTALDAKLGPRAYDLLVRLPLQSKDKAAISPIRDLDQIRGFISSSGFSALFDLPWIPLYLAICFSFNFGIGLVATVGAVVLVAMTLLTERLTKDPVTVSARTLAARSRLTEASRRNAEVLAAMGFRGAMAMKWLQANTQYTTSQEEASDVGGGLSAFTRVLRAALQSGILGFGAYLVINQMASGGVMFASSMMMSRALAPVELTIANWRNFISARDSWARLKQLMNSLPVSPTPLAMPLPHNEISVTQITVAPPGERRIVADGVTFSLKAGQALGVIGPSAAGKSSLARTLVGVWAPVRGEIRFDGATPDRWDLATLGRAIGYLPQDVELFEGTVAENISRFDVSPDPDAILRAAKAAAVHELILRLPEGYETPIGEGGASLSAGQRQRIGLARALYGDPFLIVLDEPNSNLDADGDDALNRAVLEAKSRGAIVIVVAHRPLALTHVDLVLILKDGRQQAFGPRDEVLRQLAQPAATNKAL
jgi:ATP-binding cassette subfamily C protein